MKTPPRYRLTDDEKDAPLTEQAALIARLAARITELEALVGKPRKTPSNSHIPPSRGGPGRKNREPDQRRKARPSRPGVSRPPTQDPDKTERRPAAAESQTCR